MAVRMVFHRAVREWRRTVEAGPGGSPGLAAVCLEALESQLIRTRGRPKGAVFTNWLTPPMAVWEFQFRRSWVVYLLRDRGGLIARLLARSGLEIVLLQILDHLPPRAEPASLATELSPRGRGPAA
jgi:hypothetical protein